MKTSGIFLLILSSVILLLVAICASLNYSFPLVFYLVCTGQLFLLLAVYKILKEHYTPKETFEEFYENVTGDNI